MFFPLAKSAERESQYNWILPLAKYDCWLYALKPGIQIKNLSDLKKYRVGVLSGSMREEELKKYMGTENIEGMTVDQGNFRKLLSGRVDIWATQEPILENAVSLEKERNKNFKRPRPLHKLFSQELWLVGNRDMELAEKEMVKSVFLSRINRKVRGSISIEINLASSIYLKYPGPLFLYTDTDASSGLQNF